MGGICTVDNCIISNNISLSTGGGINITGGANVSLANSTVSNNSSDAGGGVAVGVSRFVGEPQSGNKLTMVNSRVSGNTASIGGGIVSQADSVITLNESSVSGNTSETGPGLGGGMSLANRTKFTAFNSTISGNLAGTGGAIATPDNSQVSIRLENTELSNNSSLGVFLNGAIRLDGDGSILNVINGTISGNVNGGILARNEAIVNLDHTTMFDNNTLGVSAVLQSTINIISSSILANAGRGTDCSILPGTLSSGTVNVDAATIIEDGSCNASRMGDPGLLPLVFNGGPTRTHALKDDSVAIDSGEPSTCPLTDQRGEKRDGLCDVGSFELVEVDIDQSSTFVVPLHNRKSVVIEL